MEVPFLAGKGHQHEIGLDVVLQQVHQHAGPDLCAVHARFDLLGALGQERRGCRDQPREPRALVSFQAADQRKDDASDEVGVAGRAGHGHTGGQRRPLRGVGCLDAVRAVEDRAELILHPGHFDSRRKKGNLEVAPPRGHEGLHRTRRVRGNVADLVTGSREPAHGPFLNDQHAGRTSLCQLRSQVIGFRLQLRGRENRGPRPDPNIAHVILLFRPWGDRLSA